jgi:hypothetical protein
MIFPNKTVRKGRWEDGHKIESFEVDPATAEAVMLDILERERKYME